MVSKVADDLRFISRLEDFLRYQSLKITFFNAKLHYTSVQVY